MSSFSALFLSILEDADSVLPSFADIVNYPSYIGKRPGKSKTKPCVMCGIERPFTMMRRAGEDDSQPAHIIRKTKSICTACQETVWKVVDSGVVIKWCRKCSKFCPWQSFSGKKGKAKKTCRSCRQENMEKEKKRQSLQHASLGDSGDTAPSGGGIKRTKKKKTASTGAVPKEARKRRAKKKPEGERNAKRRAKKSDASGSEPYARSSLRRSPPDLPAMSSAGEQNFIEIQTMDAATSLVALYASNDQPIGTASCVAKREVVVPVHRNRSISLVPTPSECSR